MNKIIILAVVALAAVASAHDISEEYSELYVFAPEDREETAALGINGLSIFNDYCISTRDYIFKDMTDAKDNTLSKIFRTFMDSAKEIVDDAVETANKSAAKLAPQLANPAAEIAEASPADTIDQIIADGQKQIQNAQKGEGILGAFKSAFAAIAHTVSKKANAHLNALKAFAQNNVLEGKLGEICGKFNEYEETLIEMLENIKPTLPEDKQEISFDQIPCATSSKVFFLRKACHFVEVFADPAKRTMNMFRMLRGVPVNVHRKFDELN